MTKTAVPLSPPIPAEAGASGTAPGAMDRTGRDDGRRLQAVEAAALALRRGEGVRIAEDGDSLLVYAVETLDEATRQRLVRPALVLTARRAMALKLASAATQLAGERRSADRPVMLDAGGESAAGLLRLADPTDGAAGRHPALAARGDLPVSLAAAGVDLAKIARLLPSVLLVAEGEAGTTAAARAEVQVDAEAVAEFRLSEARSLRPVTAAQVPLAGAENTTIHAFRPADGSAEHLAIVIGAPRPGEAVLARIHSECFTGDLLGSLRCDCGDQLRGAIEEISKAGSGVLLYLAQEGRGIGLANKLRAYRLQDQGADTLDANLALGFDADERIYLPAAEMLRQLGFTRVRLLTNNPEKLAALQRCGVEVAERVAHHFPSNRHNELYLRTKAQRFGHSF